MRDCSAWFGGAMAAMQPVIHPMKPVYVGVKPSKQKCHIGVFMQQRDVLSNLKELMIKARNKSKGNKAFLQDKAIQGLFFMPVSQCTQVSPWVFLLDS